MLKVEPIQNFNGFGSGGMPGEFYHAGNMVPSQFGIEANLLLSSLSVSGSPDRFNWFTEYNGSPYAVDIAGKIFANTGGGWGLVRTPANASNGNGLITDQTGRLLYAQDRYLGMYNGAWSDSWKDLSTALTDFRPMETFLDWVLIGHDEFIALLNITDDSLNTAGFTLPSGFRVRAIKSNSHGVLVGANFGNRGVVFLWDAQSDRSIADWIWFDHTIQSICRAGNEWIVTTLKDQVLTNGYTILQKLPPPPDVLLQSQNFRCIPAGTMTINDQLLTANTIIDTVSVYTRRKTGIYILNLANRLNLFVPASNGNQADLTMGAIFQDSSAKTYASFSSTLPSAKYLAELKNGVPSSAWLVVGPYGDGINTKVAEGVKVELTPGSTAQNLFQISGFDIAVKIYNFRRQLWGYAQSNGTAPATDKIAINGTGAGFGNAMVGDEVTILSGVNAGEVRHITAITSQNTSSEVWTLDSALPNLTENNALINVQPFQLVKKFSISNASATELAELKDLYFNVKNKVKGKRYLVKILITNISNMSLGVGSTSLIFNDLGTL